MIEDDSSTVLLVEDNEHVLALNRAVLERAGYRTLTAASLAAARPLLAQYGIDLVVLDILLPDGDGLAFLPELRRATAAPVLLLTSKRDYEDIVAGLTGGAADYMSKPYRIEELLARIAALLQKRQAPPSAGLARGPLALDTVAHRAFLCGRDMLLQPREYAALLYLVRHEGEAVTAGRLYEAVWALPAQHSVAAVKTALSRLRKKLEGSGYTITFHRGAGYCFEREA